MFILHYMTRRLPSYPLIRSYTRIVSRRILIDSSGKYDYDSSRMICLQTAMINSCTMSASPSHHLLGTTRNYNGHSGMQRQSFGTRNDGFDLRTLHRSPSVFCHQLSTAYKLRLLLRPTTAELLRPTLPQRYHRPHIPRPPTTTADLLLCPLPTPHPPISHNDCRSSPYAPAANLPTSTVNHPTPPANDTRAPPT